MLRWNQAALPHQRKAPEKGTRTLTPLMESWVGVGASVSGACERPRVLLISPVCVPAGLDQHVRHHPGGPQRLPGGSLPHVHVKARSLKAANANANPPLFQDNKADVILKYNLDEARSLKAYGELPDHG